MDWWRIKWNYHCLFGIANLIHIKEGNKKSSIEIQENFILGFCEVKASDGIGSTFLVPFKRSPENFFTFSITNGSTTRGNLKFEGNTLTAQVRDNLNNAKINEFLIYTVILFVN